MSGSTVAESMVAATPSQTVGPFFGYALRFPSDADVVPAWRSDAITLHGRVLDGAGAPVPDALIETWQNAPDATAPTAAGSLRRRPDVFTGFGRAATDPDGAYVLHTLRPGPVPGHVAHLAAVVFARGLLRHLHTRIHLPEDVDEAATAADPLLSGLDPDRAATLVARTDGDRRYRFDIGLQGEHETVFLDLEHLR